MDPSGRTLAILGALLLLGFAMHVLGRRTRLPRVTLLILLGVVIGPSGADLLPTDNGEGFELVATMALVLVGFLLGERFSLASLREHGKSVLVISMTVVLVSACVVFLGLWAVGASIPLALVLAGIATATAPAATVDVIRETGEKGPFARVLEGIVALDDLWGLFLFSILLAAVGVITGSDATSELMLKGAWEIFGGVGLGIVLGVPMALLTGRVRSGELTTIEAVGCVFLCGGVAIQLGVSLLIAAMVLGAVVANVARHHERPFHAIEDIETPFLVLFFLLAGASLDLGSLVGLGSLGAAYIAFRSLGRVIGGELGGRLSRADRDTRRWIGLALFPQAGVAIGMALVAVERFPALGEPLLPLVIGSTVIFELVGPILTRRALMRVGENRTGSEA